MKCEKWLRERSCRDLTRIAKTRLPWVGDCGRFFHHYISRTFATFVVNQSRFWAGKKRDERDDVMKDQFNRFGSKRIADVRTELWCVLFSLLLGTSPVLGETNIDSTFLLSKRGAGAVLLGSSITTTKFKYLKKPFTRAYAEMTELGDEGFFTPGFKLFMDPNQDRDKPSLVVAIKCVVDPECNNDYIVEYIIVYDKRFKTARGVGVGSTIDELRDKHSTGGLDTMGHGGLHVPVPDLNMRFYLEADRAILYYHSQEQAEKLIPGDTKIRAIWIK